MATRLIASVGIVEALWLRTAIAAAVLVLVRPRSLRLPAPGHRLPIVLLTLSLFAMNLSFYGAISNAPLGVVVAVEFLGPLAVAVLGSRRRLDFVWVVLAAAGVVLLAGPTSSVSALGLGLSLLAACCWGTFISLAKRAVTHAEPLSITTLMLLGSSVLLTPLLLITGPRSLDQSSVLALGVAVALLFGAAVPRRAVHHTEAARLDLRGAVEPRAGGRSRHWFPHRLTEPQPVRDHRDRRRDDRRCRRELDQRRSPGRDAP